MSKLSTHKPKISKIGQFCIHEGKVMMRFNVVTREYNVYTREWKITKEETQFKPVEELGFTKTVEGFYVFTREGMSMQTLKTYKGYFMQNVKISIPRRNKFRFTYLKLSEPHPMSGIYRLHIRYFAVKPSVTSTLTFKEMENLEITVKRIGKPRRISKTRFEQLKQQPDYLGLFNENLTKAIIEV